MKDNNWKMLAIAGFAALGGVMWAQVIAPRDAVGYPSGAAVSYGSNPLVSAAGYVNSSTSATAVLTAPSGHSLVITDVVLTPYATASTSSTFDCPMVTRLETSGGETIGQFETVAIVSSDGVVVASVQHAFESGLVVPAGESLDITAAGSSSTCNVHFTLSGYYAEP
jgi:hypothetical protein